MWRPIPAEKSIPSDAPQITSTEYILMKLITGLVLGIMGITMAPIKTVLGDEVSSDFAIIVARDTSGQIEPKSRSSLAALRKIAKRNGHVAIWLTLNLPFVPPYQLSDPEVAEQSKRFNEHFAEILFPLLERRYIEFPRGELTLSLASALVFATDQGLGMLAEDQRIAQMVIANRSGQKR